MASLSEGKGKNYGRKGGQGSDKPVRITPFDRREARANIQDPSRSNNPVDVVRRFFNVKDEPGSVSSNVSKDELLKRLETQTKQRLSKSAQAAADVADVEPDAARIRNQAGQVAQRSRETKPQQRRPLGDTTKGGPVKTMRLGDPGAPSKESARTLQRMTTADPTTSARLQANLRAADTAPKPETIKQSDVSQRAARFRQSFGTPTGADPKTGRPTYKPLDALTNLPKGRGGTAPSPEQYAKVQVGDLDTKRLIRTQGTQGTPTPRGVENFLLNRETKGALGGRNARRISPEQGKAALERVKGFMADPKEVSRVAAQIKQEVGGRRAQLENPPARPSRSSAASTASTTAVRRVRVQDVSQPSTPTPRPTTSRAPQLPPATRQPAATPTVTKVKQALNLSIAKQPPAPEPSFKVSGTTKQTTAPQLPPAVSTTKPEPVKQSTVSQRAQTYRTQAAAGQNLEFTKTKSGSFSYKPRTSTPTPQSQAPTPEWTTTTRSALPEPAAPTRRRASGDAGPSSKLSSAPRPPVTTTTQATPQARRQNISPDLGKGSTTLRRGQSTTLRPRTATPTSPRQRGGGSGNALLNIAYGGLSGYDAYKQAIEAGKSSDVALQRGLARGAGTTSGAMLGGRIGRAVLGGLGSKFGTPGKAIGQSVGEFGGSLIGGQFGGDAATAVAGIDKKDRDWMRWANRSVQTGVPAQSARSRTGSTSVIRDTSGKERVGYLAYRDGKPVYKTANDPSSLKYTSSNPLERIGRTVAYGNYGPVSDWLRSRYAASDDATRRAKVASQKARGGNK